MQMEIKMFKNIEGKKQELFDKIRETEERQKSLKSVLTATVSAVDDAKKRLEHFEVYLCKLINFFTNIRFSQNTLEKNDLYCEFVMLGKQLEQIEMENEKIEEEIKQRIMSEEATKLLEEIGSMTKKSNELLISTLKKNKAN